MLRYNQLKDKTKELLAATGLKRDEFEELLEEFKKKYTMKAEMGMTPERDAAKVAENELAQEERAELLIDGSERRRQRPKNAEKQKEHYSGKKKAHTDKNILLVNSQTRKVVYLSPTEGGQKHDKRMVDDTPITYPSGATLGKDTGFQGYEPKGVHTFQPKKSPKARN